MKTKKLSIWDCPITLALGELAWEGFTHRTIARALKIGQGAVEYRLRRIGIKTANVRAGKGELARERINKVLKKHRLLPGERKAA